MRLHFIAEGNIQTGNAEGVVTYACMAGQTVDVPEDVAVLFLNAGVAEPVKAEKAAKPAAEKAVKK